MTDPGALGAGEARGSVVVLGAGRLGGGLARGLVLSGFPQESLYLVQRDAGKRQALAAEGFAVGAAMPSEGPVVAVIVATKPKDVPAATRGLDELPSHVPAVSLAAGIDLATLERLCGARPVFRARPNLFVERACGNVLMAEPAHGHEAAFGALRRLFARVGRVFVVPEPAMEALTWDSSSVPAVVVGRILRERISAAGSDGRMVGELLLGGLEGLLDRLRAAVQAGVPLSTALDDVAARVVTPGGVNDAALGVLERAAVWEALERAADAYRAREAELRLAAAADAREPVRMVK